MTPDKIKQKIQILLNKYQENSGTIKGFDVIFDYIDFLKKEPYTASLLKENFDYADKQIALLEASALNQNIEVPNVHKIFEFKDTSEVPMHKDMIAVGLEQQKNQEHASMEQILPLALTNLVLLYQAMARVKEQLQNNEPIEDKLNILKDLPVSTLRVKVGEELASQPFALFASASLLTTAKYILDNIDCEELANAKTTKKEPWFDKNKSILHFMGEEINIRLKGEKPNDHYILEAIFNNEDKTEEVYFKDIAKDYLGMEEYDKTKDWQILRRACDQLNTKVAKAVDNYHDKFIVYATGQTGWCKINQIHL
ncbi:MAG: hypothetical protein PHX90_04485 [Thermotogota bacterium]|nr:hypothetical protein [Thermotogota bacterium]